MGAKDGYFIRKQHERVVQENGRNQVFQSSFPAMPLNENGDKKKINSHLQKPTNFSFAIHSFQVAANPKGGSRSCANEIRRVKSLGGKIYHLITGSDFETPPPVPKILKLAISELIEIHNTCKNLDIFQDDIYISTTFNVDDIPEGMNSLQRKAFLIQKIREILRLNPQTTKTDSLVLRSSMQVSTLFIYIQKREKIEF